MGKAVQGGSVTFEDIAGKSPAISAGRESRDVTRIGKIAWSSIDALILELFPPAPALPGAYPGVAYLYANTLRVSPFHPDPSQSEMTCGDVASYTYALAEITYSRLPYESSDLLTRRYSFSVEALIMPGMGLHWEGDAADKIIEVDDVYAAKQIPLVEHSITLHRVTAVQFAARLAAIRDNIGHVNDGEFEGAADNTLLFCGAEAQFTLSTDGSMTWTLDYRFQERRITDGNNIRGWQHIWNPKTKKWARPQDADGNFLYPESSDFDDLL